jgi:hypothetical protein
VRFEEEGPARLGKPVFGPVPTTEMVANGAPLSKKATGPPSGLPVVQMTTAVKVTGVRKNGCVFDADSAVLEIPTGLVAVTGADVDDPQLPVP